MKRRYIIAIDSIFILAMLAGCSPTASPAGNAGLSSSAQNYQVEIINLTEPVYETIRTESIDQPNCNGTGDVDNVVERTMGINHSIELGLGLTVDIDGKLELFGTGVDLGAAISSELGYQYGIIESISRSITVRAAPKTHVVHTVKLSEVWESGTARVISNGEAIDIPFRFRANFSIDLLESAPVSCPTEQSAIQQIQATNTPALSSQTNINLSLPFCFGNCWEYDENARTMTWTRPADGTEDVWQPQDNALQKIRNGYTAIFTTTISGEIFACTMVMNGQSINSCGLYEVPAGTYQITSSGNNGGFRWCPPAGQGWRQDGGQCK